MLAQCPHSSNLPRVSWIKWGGIPSSTMGFSQAEAGAESRCCAARPLLTAVPGNAFRKSFNHAVSLLAEPIRRHEPLRKTCCPLSYNQPQKRKLHMNLIL